MLPVACAELAIRVRSPLGWCCAASIVHISNLCLESWCYGIETSDKYPSRSIGKDNPDQPTRIYNLDNASASDAALWTPNACRKPPYLTCHMILTS